MFFTVDLFYVGWMYGVIVCWALYVIKNRVFTYERPSVEDHKGRGPSADDNKGPGPSVDDNKGPGPSVDDNKGSGPSVDGSMVRGPSVYVNKGPRPSVDDNMGPGPSVVDQNGREPSVDDKKGCRLSVNDKNGCGPSIDDKMCRRTSVYDKNGCGPSVNDKKGGGSSVDDEGHDNALQEALKYKMALLVRQDLKMRKKKVTAQCSQATVHCSEKGSRLCPEKISLWKSNNKPVDIFKVANEELMLKYHEVAIECGYNTYIVVDAGCTRGAPRSTVLAIGPEMSEQINLLTGNLEVYI